MGIKIDLVAKTVENTGTDPVTIKELIEKTTVIAPGVTITLDADTKTIEI